MISPPVDFDFCTGYAHTSTFFSAASASARTLAYGPRCLPYWLPPTHTFLPLLYRCYCSACSRRSPPHCCCTLLHLLAVFCDCICFLLPAPCAPFVTCCAPPGGSISFSLDLRSRPACRLCLLRTSRRLLAAPALHLAHTARLNFPTLLPRRYLLLASRRLRNPLRMPTSARCLSFLLPAYAAIAPPLSAHRVEQLCAAPLSSTRTPGIAPASCRLRIAPATLARAGYFHDFLALALHRFLFAACRLSHAPFYVLRTCRRTLCVFVRSASCSHCWNPVHRTALLPACLRCRCCITFTTALTACAPRCLRAALLPSSALSAATVCRILSPPAYLPACLSARILAHNAHASRIGCLRAAQRASPRRWCRAWVIPFLCPACTFSFCSTDFAHSGYLYTRLALPRLPFLPASTPPRAASPQRYAIA